MEEDSSGIPLDGPPHERGGTRGRHPEVQGKEKGIRRRGFQRGIKVITRLRQLYRTSSNLAELHKTWQTPPNCAKLHWNLTETDTCLAGRFRWVSGDPCEGDNLTVFCDKDGKCGYLNVKTGEIVIPAQYSKAWNFSEGLAAVLGGDDCIGFIDKDNRLVIDYIIPFEKGQDYVFKEGYCLAMHYIDDTEQYALYRKDGIPALDWSHIRIEEPENGYSIVANDYGCWLLNSELNCVFPDAYDEISLADAIEGVHVTKNHAKRLLSYDGAVLESFVIDNTYRLEYEVVNENGDAYSRIMVDDVLVYMVDGLEGLMDAWTGRIITPAIYWNFEMVSKDLLRAKLVYGDESVILDKTGKVIK